MYTATKSFERFRQPKSVEDVSNALFKYEKASEDQGQHVSKILSADQSSNRNLKEEIQ